MKLSDRIRLVKGDGGHQMIPEPYVDFAVAEFRRTGITKAATDPVFFSAVMRVARFLAENVTGYADQPEASRPMARAERFFNALRTHAE